MHGGCQTIVTHFRPVPLTWQFCWGGPGGETEMVQLLGKKGRGLNPALGPLQPAGDAEWSRGERRRWRRV